MSQLPTGWLEYGRNGSDSVTFVRPGHTVEAPRLAIFDRKQPVANGNGFSIPQYRIRLIDGHLDADGLPLKERSIVEVVIRHPLSATDTSVETSIAAVAALLADTQVVGNATDDLMFPRETVGV